MAREKVVDALSFVRDLVWRALWDIQYHERELYKTTALAKFAKELLERAGIDADKVRAEWGNYDPEDESAVENVEQFACKTLDSEIHGVGYHEEALLTAHKQMSFVQSLLARGSYTEINVAEIQKAIDEEKKQ